MEFITWKDSFSVKVPSIDNQHQKLVSIVNEFYKKFYEGMDQEFLHKIFKELEDYAVYHFDYEEKYMKKFAFKGYEEHKQEHEQFKETIADYKESLDVNDSKGIIDFATFLKNWLLKHIMGTDKKYSTLFREKGLK
ncbi:MAG: bacteriohemerythrin [Bacteroidales bacterium]|nr:bacteriohemerythrin [Bacteroidales bacterium]